MIWRFVALHVTRTANVVALLAVALSTYVAGRLSPDHASFASELERASDGGASSAWAAGVIVCGILVTLRAARAGDGWFSRESEWLGASPRTNLALAMNTALGVAVGAAALVALVAVVARSIGATPANPVASWIEAGPKGSIVLAPGERFEQSFAMFSLPERAKVRVRVTPTLGGDGIDSVARIEMDDVLVPERVRVVRRTWLEIDAAPTSSRVLVTNEGPGALAVLGPRAVQVWAPEVSLASGHLRVAGHAFAMLLTLALLAQGLSFWMSPGVAAMLAFASWLGVRFLFDLWGYGGTWPAASEWPDVLATIREGRIPRAPTLSIEGFACLFALTACATSSRLVRTLHDEVRA